jgi:peptidoglycan/LPS O-acetylase OafA/YrhL
MKNKLFLIVSIAFIIIGAIISYFAKIPLAQISGFAVTMFGAGLAVGKLWNDRDKTAKSWLVILGMILIGLGAFVAGLTGVITEAQVTAVIGYVFSLILIIAGIIASVVANKETKKIE